MIILLIALLLLVGVLCLPEWGRRARGQVYPGVWDPRMTGPYWTCGTEDVDPSNMRSAPREGFIHSYARQHTGVNGPETVQGKYFPAE